MSGFPVIAIPSKNFMEILTKLAHTPEDTVDKVDCE